MRDVAERLWRSGVPAVYVTRDTLYAPDWLDPATIAALLAKILVCAQRVCGPGCVVYECGESCYTVLYDGDGVLVYPGCSEYRGVSYHT